MTATRLNVDLFWSLYRFLFSPVPLFFRVIVSPLSFTICVLYRITVITTKRTRNFWRVNASRFFLYISPPQTTTDNVAGFTPATVILFHELISQHRHEILRKFSIRLLTYPLFQVFFINVILYLFFTHLPFSFSKFPSIMMFRFSQHVFFSFIGWVTPSSSKWRRDVVSFMHSQTHTHTQRPELRHRR